MTAFAACLFAFAALISAGIIAASWCRHGKRALSLRGELKACPGEMAINWKSIERRRYPGPFALRMDRAVRPVRQNTPAQGLEWPGLALAA